MQSFWNSLPKPFFASAPMAEVTDAAFRTLVAKRGKPDVMWTEFVSADGLYHFLEKKKTKSAKGMIYHTFNTNPLLRDLQYSEAERPIVAQLFSNKPEMIVYAAKVVAELGFDGVDLNMGCPDKSIEKQGAGAALIKRPELAAKLIQAAKEGFCAGLQNLNYSSKIVDSDATMPVSVKTRVGYNKESLDEWLTALLEAEPAAITLHLRTRKEMSLVPADWELMKKAVALRDRLSPETLLIGNGDVASRRDGERLARETGCDGIMIGRGMFGNPWVFAGRKPKLCIPGLHNGCANQVCTTVAEKLAALIELAHGFEKLSPPKSFAILKKHIKAFVTGFAGAAELRAKLMETSSAAELEAVAKLVPKA